MSDRYCLIGDPIAHSPSPAMHNAGFAALGLDATYTLRPATEATVHEVWGELERGAWAGCNVTTPLKGAAAERFPGSGRVERSGSANTIYRRDGALRAESTDVDGVRIPLEAHGVRGGEALLLGAGGAARAAALALEDLDLTVHVAARDPSRAAALLERVAPRPRGRALALNDLDRDRSLAERLRVIVQATPVGRNGETFSLPWERLPDDCVAFEMLYARTPFLETADARGLVRVEGWEMLLWQGVEAFRRWTGAEPPVAPMRTALLEALI